jgi:hypothetical protein
MTAARFRPRCARRPVDRAGRARARSVLVPVLLFGHADRHRHNPWHGTATAALQYRAPTLH